MEEIIVMEKLVGKLNNPVINKYPELEDITITPTKEEQVFNSKKYGYDTVVVDAYIPDTEDIVITPYDRIQQFTSNKDGYKNIVVKAIDTELPELENLTVTPTKEEQLFKSEKYGFNEVTVEGYVPDTEDITITPRNNVQQFTSNKDGYKNITVEAVDVELPELENVTIVPTKEQQQFTSEKYGFDKVTVEGYVLDTEDIAIIPTNKEQIFASDKDGYKNVVVKAIKGETLNIKPTTVPQTFNGLYETVNVEKVEVVETEEVSINPDFRIQDTYEVIPSEGKYITKVIVNKDVNLVPENIVEGTSIYGIDGTGESGIDTSDATATAENIDEGKTAYINGKKVVGTRKLPYIKLEYIESDGNQYINTKTKASQSISAELTVQCTNTNKSAFFGAWMIKSNNNFAGIMFGQSTDPEYNSYVMATSSVWKPSGVSLDINQYHTFIYDAVNTTGTVDGEVCDVPSNSGTTLDLYMFRANGFDERTSGVRISRCKIYDNGVLIHDYIPVKRKVDGVVCMYDLVYCEFVFNAGSGSFTAGPEIEPTVASYKQLEYIESDGNQYIDTGISASAGVGAELTVQCTNTDTTSFFGAWDIISSSGGEKYAGLMFGQSIESNFEGYLMATSSIWMRSGVDVDTTEFHTFIYDGVTGIGTVDGQNCPVPLNTGTNNKLYIFRASVFERPTSGVRISRCKIYNNGLLIRDYVPVIRKTDNVICMYDLVNSQYALNNGSGSFIPGPEIV